jgi:TetR/AcrR family transcriptional repressor of nem operon
MSTERPSSRISRRGEQTREQIMVAARQLFTERGYHTTSVYDLFEHAGITKGAFFHHWKTKEDLALALFDDMRRTFEDHLFIVARGDARAREKMDRLLRQLCDISASPRWIYVRMFALWCAELRPDEEKIGPAVHALKARWSMLWKELILKAQQESDMRADISAENLSFLVSSAILGVQLMNGNQTSHSDSTKVALDTLRRTLLT